MKDQHIIYVKHMVCPRCVTSVIQILDTLNISFEEVALGKAVLSQKPDQKQKEALVSSLKKQGFEILQSNEHKIVSAIKSYLIKKIENPSIEGRKNLSSELPKLLAMDYSAISRTFADTEGITIERYAMTLKTEKIKELLSYGEQTISEIAFQLNYSSAAHLSGQFRKMTGMSPSEFRKLHYKPRRFISEL